MARYHRWTPQEEEFIRDNILTLSNAEIAKALKIRDEQIISDKVYNMGLRRPHKVVQKLMGRVGWNKDQESYVIRNAKVLSVEQMALVLNLPPDAVREKIYKLTQKGILPPARAYPQKKYPEPITNQQTQYQQMPTQQMPQQYQPQQQQVEMPEPPGKAAKIFNLFRRKTNNRLY